MLNGRKHKCFCKTFVKSLGSGHFGYPASGLLIRRSKVRIFHGPPPPFLPFFLSIHATGAGHAAHRGQKYIYVKSQVRLSRSRFGSTTRAIPKLEYCGRFYTGLDGVFRIRYLTGTIRPLSKLVARLPIYAYVRYRPYKATIAA